MEINQKETKKGTGTHKVAGQPQYDPRYQALPPISDDEIDLLALWRVMMKRKGLIASIVAAAAILSVIVSLRLPNIYRATTVLAPVSGETSTGGAAALLGQFGGLASMAGISMGGGSAEVNLAVLKSRSFIKEIVKKNKLMPLLFPDEWDETKKNWIETDPEAQPTLWDAYRLLNGVLTVSTDKKSGLTSVSLEREDPEQAAKWLTLFIKELNRHLKDAAIREGEANIAYLNEQIIKTPILEMRQTIYGVIAEQTKQLMLAMTQHDFAFKIIDPAEVPDKKFKPKRSLIVILSTFVAGFMAIFLVFFMEFIERRKDEEPA